MKIFLVLIKLFILSERSKRNAEMLDKMNQTEPKVTENPKSGNLPVVDRALSSNKKCLNFMSIPLVVFKQVLIGLRGQFLPGVRIESGHVLSESDQLALFYNKCKTNNTNGVLAINFGFNPQLVSKVFKHVEKILFDYAKDHLFWLSKEQNEALMPRVFKENYPKCRAILDCFEVGMTLLLEYSLISIELI